MVATEQETWGPELRGGASPRRRSLLRTSLVALLAVVLVATAYGTGAALYANARIDHVEAEGLAPAMTNPFHVLVVGTDSREGMTDEQIRELHTGRAEGVRADTLFVMTIGWNGTALLAFPRDLQVTRCDGSVGRINAALAVGGPECLIETVRSTSGIPISRYLEVSFLGFDEIVDAVGGVELCLDEPIADSDAGIDLPEGCQRLLGRDALGYVRVRKIDDDLQRIQRQQEFLRALADEIVSPSVILNPPRLYGTAGQIGEALTADDGTGPIDLARIGLGIRQLAAGRTVAHTVPTQPSGDVLALVEDEARVLFDRYRDGRVLDEAAGTEGPTPADVELTVLNGAGVSGLAGRTADALEAAGFTVADIGNADPVDATVVRYPPGSRAEAELTADEIGRLAGTTVAISEDPSVERVTLVLGADAADG